MEYAIKKDGNYESIVFRANVIQTEGRGTITLQARIENNKFASHQSLTKNNQVTQISLPADLKLVSKLPFSYTVPMMVPRYMDKKKVEDYLYEITYGNIDYEYAYKYFKPSFFGGCSAIRNGVLFGRNFDWLYNNQVQFVVHTPTSLDHYAVLGVSGAVPGVEQSNVDNWNIIVDGVDMFKLVPFYLLDGMNEKGVFCTHNLVPLDSIDSPTMEIPAKKHENERVCIPMLVRFILDRFATAEQAIEYIRDYVTLFFTEDMIDAGYQSHFLLGDTNSTYALEFMNGEMRVIKTNYITNFNISGVTFGKKNEILYPPTSSGIDKFGFGLERWDTIAQRYNLCRNKEAMTSLLDDLRYSNCYGEPFWTSELVKCTDDQGDDITVDTDPSLCSGAIEEMRFFYENRDRNEPRVWITTHSSVYNLSLRQLEISNQESDTRTTFLM